jgi:hypothetical protein
VDGSLASIPHIASIEELQPYRGCEWTAVLKNLSNPDKHRGLLSRQFDNELTMHIVDKDHIADFSDMPGAIRTAVTSDGTEVYVKAVLAITLQFDDGAPVIETLETIKVEVARVLQTFQADFERAKDMGGENSA